MKTKLTSPIRITLENGRKFQIRQNSTGKFFVQTQFGSFEKTYTNLFSALRAVNRINNPESNAYALN